MFFHKILWRVTENQHIRFILNKSSWPVIKKIGGSKFIQSFTIWVIMVPLFAKVFYKIPDEIIINILNAQLTIVCNLPFKLTIFYFCSLLFGLSNIIYMFSCPALIKEYSSGSDFVEKGGSIIELKENITKLDPEQQDAYNLLLYEQEIKDIEQKKLELYTQIVNDLKLKFIEVRFILILLYLFGFLFLLWIMFDNLVAVLGASF